MFQVTPWFGLGPVFSTSRVRRVFTGSLNVTTACGLSLKQTHDHTDNRNVNWIPLTECIQTVLSCPWPRAQIWSVPAHDKGAAVASGPALPGPEHPPPLHQTTPSILVAEAPTVPNWEIQAPPRHSCPRCLPTTYHLPGTGEMAGSQGGGDRQETSRQKEPEIISVVLSSTVAMKLGERTDSGWGWGR